ncbi:hypothetical protein SAMN04489712_106171 [Thermomonospora echinospora]|uniref:Uncharacterized protein n=1 Tax=Thermomonospora echinospora TaxID=1992 RepID=A0A1H6B373_9ACTN|nr:hypothetical protein [Thermomonospora echinospora]SEG54667.1 hypothetical protein SAMN04489712_106171 [Thermomonospora echinospora]
MRLVAVAALLAACTITPAQAAAGPRPGVSVEPGQAAAGTSARVRGSAWTPGTTVQIQVCGANAVHGSADCDTEHGVTAMVAPTGAFEAGLTVGAPPAACPCVIRVSTLPGGAGEPVTVVTPFTVQGHRVEPVIKDVVPVRADVVGLEVVGGGERGELFGGRPRRTLVLQIRNSGPEPIENAPLVAGWGAGDTPDTPLDAPRTGILQPGQTATYRIPVELPPASFGRFVVGGRYAGSVPFETAFSTYPWGLLGVNLLAALLLLFGIRLALGRWAARRRRRRTAASSARGATSAAGAGPAHHRVAPRSSDAVEVADLIAYLDSVASSPSGAYVVDRDELIGYLEGRRGGAMEPVDIEALDRFLALPRGEDR